MTADGPWTKPLRFALVADTGYPSYRNILSVRARDRAVLGPCLRRLVPIVQRAQVEFMAKPGPTIDLLAGLNQQQYRSGFFYDTDVARYGYQTMRDGGLVSNGTNKTLGDFDLTDRGRVQKLIDIVSPIMATKRKPVRPGLRPEDVATNEFIDPAISLSGKR